MVMYVRLSPRNSPRTLTQFWCGATQPALEDSALFSVPAPPPGARASLRHRAMSAAAVGRRACACPSAVAQRPRQKSRPGPPPALQQRPPLGRAGSAAASSGGRRRLEVSCRDQRGWSGGGGGPGRRRRGAGDDGRLLQFRWRDVDVALAEEQLWRLAVPLTLLFGAAVFIGPLVVGITLSAVAVGAAFSAGALAFTSLLLPLLLLSGLGGLLSFGVVATLGVAVAIPKLIFSVLSLGFVAGGLLLGSAGVNWLLSLAAGSAPERGTDSDEDDDGGSSVAAAAAEAEARRIEDELRSFDELLARRQRRQREEGPERGRW